VLDNLSTGHRWAISDFEFIEGDILNTETLARAMKGVDAVCHFAAKIVVSESVQNPSAYWKNNVDGTASVLSAMHRTGVKRLVFSSTAAVYGMPEYGVRLITENHPCRPINPYGMGKLQAERLIAQWVESGFGKAIAFRYFNAAGALPEVGLGEAHDPETHLIPNVLRALINNDSNGFRLYGSDYPTPDGSCIRDYVHVVDIAKAHISGLDALDDSLNAYDIFNLGSGGGYSNLEVIKACETLIGRSLNYDVMSRREGDPHKLVASYEKAKELLDWYPANSKLETIIESALEWHLFYG
jgi:UDP-glucose 4-epimerase